jgi:hypothetical protein
MTALGPDVSIPNAIPNWAQTEAAKRWALDNLGRWHWFRPEDPGTRPVFRMLAEGPTPVAMGHVEGVVTISVAEADPVLRTTRREALQEPYRTMLGHMRHEIAHMLWWRLSLREDFLNAFRERFGDERADYQVALQRHYIDGPPPDWKQRFLTTYASAHPHEDWAETTAHLLHLTDTPWPQPSTGAYGLRVPAPIGGFLCLRALDATGGTAVAIPEDRIHAASGTLAAGSGLDICPEGGAAWAAYELLVDQGWIGQQERTVVFNTGTGLKYR